jgi:tRNA-2-methylthio-N6-dimethylallyladenosine synthase
MTTQRLFIHTIGCQMNVYDSDRIVRLLAARGYQQTRQLEGADLVIVNTCAIRAKAEQKAFSFIGRLARLKKRRPGLMIAVGGCVAQQEGEAILARMPIVDVVFGTQAIARLPGLLEAVRIHRQGVVDVGQGGTIDEVQTKAEGFVERGVSRFVTIMQGCDNYCTYCVVPYVRGTEKSRQPERILTEIQTLVKEGVREVTLLGQNVNSYGRKEGLPSFAELLERINAIDGLQRIRFTTSHPKDLSEDLMQAFGCLPKLCPHIHLPVQSGSDRILKRMNRNYTREVYLERIARLRRIRPDIAVTSDFIVGFPGESPADFQKTLALVSSVRFDGIFAFMYSDREIAPASRLAQKVGASEKSERLQTLLATQETITLEKHRALVGRIEPILVEGNSSRPGLKGSAADGPQWTGRTPGNKIVNFTPAQNGRPAVALKVGALVEVMIENAFSHSLLGRLIPGKPTTPCQEGEKCHAA